MPFSLRDAKDLCAAVAYWVGFRTVLGRHDHLSERNLSEPISDFLISRTRPWTLSSEFNHPAIQQPARGRPKQFDFVLQQNETIKVCLETKFGICSPVELISDALRLSLLRGQVYRLFLHVTPVDAFRALHDMQMTDNGGAIRKLVGILDVNGKAGTNFHDILARARGSNPTRHARWLAKIISDFNNENPLRDGFVFAGGITTNIIERKCIEGYVVYVVRVGRLQRVGALDFADIDQVGIADEDA